MKPNKIQRPALSREEWKELPQVKRYNRARRTMIVKRVAPRPGISWRRP